MLTFKSIADVVDKLSANDSARPVVSSCMRNLIQALHPYNPEFDGYLVLIEATDVEGPLKLPELPRRLIDVPWEGATRLPGYFHVIYLANNEYGLSFLIPDAPWVRGRLRELLEEMVAG